MVLNRDKALQVREFTENILHRARFLDVSDRALLEQVMGRGVRPREVAAVTGISARAVQRRVRVLILRLNRPRTLQIIRQHHRWDPLTASVGLALYLKRKTLRQAADELGLTFHQVRQQALLVRALVQAPAKPGRPLPAPQTFAPSLLRRRPVPPRIEGKASRPISN